MSATGATSVVGTNGATFYITGVQLEVGTAATNFDVRSYGTELMLCQRYYFKSNMGTNGIKLASMYTTTGNRAFVQYDFHCTMRTDPTVTYTISAGGTFNFDYYSPDYAQIYFTVTGTAVNISAFTASAEL